MLHKTPSPDGIVRELIDNHGWEGKDGNLCFRHTIYGKTTARGFFIVNNDNKKRLEVRHKTSDIVAYWTHDETLNAISSKMRRLVCVSGETKEIDGVKKVCYKSAQAFTGLKITNIIPAIHSGIIKVDFDARYQNEKKGSIGIRDHGTKFRIKIRDLPQIYGKVENI